MTETQLAQELGITSVIVGTTGFFNGNLILTVSSIPSPVQVIEKLDSVFHLKPRPSCYSPLSSPKELKPVE